MINNETMEPLKNQTVVSHNYQILKNLLVLKFNECDVVVSPWSYEKTFEWYKNELGLLDYEDITAEYVDIENEGMWEILPKTDEDYEVLTELFYIKGAVELIRDNPKNKFNNISIYDGELCVFISYKDFCDREFKHGNNMKEPEIIASSER